MRELNAALVSLVHAGGMLDRGEGLPLQKDRLPLAAARSRAIGGEIVQLDVKQQQFVPVWLVTSTHLRRVGPSSSTCS